VSKITRNALAAQQNARLTQHECSDRRMSKTLGAALTLRFEAQSGITYA
jgi:hypothetical protein